MDTPAVALGPSLAVKTLYSGDLTSGRMGIHFVLQSKDPLTYYSSSIDFVVAFTEKATSGGILRLDHSNEFPGRLTMTVSCAEALSQKTAVLMAIKRVAFDRRQSIQEGSISCNYKRNPRSTRARCSLPVGHDGNHSYRER